MRFKIRKIGFTLSEVLITLGIIGIVAAMTLPNIIAKYKQSVMVNQLKKAYSVMSQAMLFTVQKDGDLTSLNVRDYSQESINNWYKFYLKPYMNVTHECYNEVGCWAKGVKTIGGVTPYYGSNRGIGENIVVFTTLDGFNVSLDAYGNTGMRFGVKSENGASDFLLVFVDVNGNKRPNIVGKDIHAFVFSPSRGFVPAGRDLSDKELNANCNASNKTVYGGYYCFEKIMRNGWRVDNEF